MNRSALAVLLLSLAVVSSAGSAIAGPAGEDPASAKAPPVRVAPPSHDADQGETAVRELFTSVAPAEASPRSTGEAPSPSVVRAQPVTADPGQPGSEAQDPGVIRTRLARVNLDRLQEVEEIALNLFDDATLLAIRDRVEQRSEGRFTWFGRVRDAVGSSVILTIEDGDLVGQVRIEGKMWHVRPLGEGLHVVRQLDPTVLPRNDCSPRRPPQPERYEAQPPAGGDDAVEGLLADDGSTIDIMVLYTDDAGDAVSNIGAEIQHAVDVTNQTYANSFIQQRLRLVHRAEVSYAENGDPDATLDCLTFTNDGCLDQIHAWRDQYRADLVTLLVEHGMNCNPLGCWAGQTTGVAWMMESLGHWFESYAFSVVRRGYASDDFVLAHEAGHNMGAHHDVYAAGSETTLFPYSHGYVWSSWPYCRQTVMAYQNYCNDNLYLDTTRIGYWSSPNIYLQICEWPLGWPCTASMPIGNAATADNHRTLNETAYTVANFRESNRAPVSDAGGPYGAECQGSHTSLRLHGTGSSDPDPGDTLSYEWSSDCPGASFDNWRSPEPTLTVDSSEGCSLACNVSLRVTDEMGASDLDSATVAVHHDRPPVVECPPSVTVECDQPTDPAQTGAATATDVCDSNPAISHSDEVLAGRCPEERMISRTWAATDVCGNASTCVQGIAVVDTTAPALTCGVALGELWPPNHEFVDVGFWFQAADNCDPDLEYAVAVSSDEHPAFEPGSGGAEHCPDAVVQEGLSVWLRAERSGGGDGRTYVITVTASDGCGNRTACSATVVVPKSRGKGSPAPDSGQAFDAMACEGEAGEGLAARDRSPVKGPAVMKE